MKVYANVLPPTMGRVMYRINSAIKRYAPDDVQFVNSPEKADLQILDVIGTGNLRYLTGREYIILQHCYRTAETQDPGFWLPIFRRARLVVSYHDLRELTGSDDFPFYRCPWGADPSVFRPSGLQRTHAIITTGYNDDGEAIRECHDAATSLPKPSIHLNKSHALGWMNGYPLVTVIDDVNDAQLASYYSLVDYVSGLRRGEGFELPVVEGLLCGARPIVFDTLGYHYWFTPHAVFLPETSREELTSLLKTILSSRPLPVTLDERDTVSRKFDWEVIMTRFWQLVYEQRRQTTNAASS